MPRENPLLRLLGEDLPHEKKRAALRELEDIEHLLSERELRILNAHRENYRELLGLPR